MYGIQMIFGFKITSVILKLVRNNSLTNIITIITIITLSLLVHYIFNIKQIIKKTYLN